MNQSIPSAPVLPRTAWRGSILLASTFLACGLLPQDDGGADPDRPAQLTFEQDGKTYAIVDGEAYELRGDGRRKFIGHLFDPDFHAKSFETRDGKLWRKDVDNDRLYEVDRQFSDGFEGARSTGDLITVARWHSYNTDPQRADRKDNFYDIGNRIEITDRRVHGGEAALRFHAEPLSKGPSKASIVRSNLYFVKGDVVEMSGWFFLEDTPDIYDGGGFTLMDLESTFFDGYVGVRVIFRRGDALSFEMELPKTQFRQAAGRETAFPTEQWVQVRAQTQLSDEDGWVKIWQNGRLVLDERGRTLPLPDTVYDRFEVGISAIAQKARYSKTLYLDDVSISKIDGSR